MAITNQVARELKQEMHKQTVLLPVTTMALALRRAAAVNFTLAHLGAEKLSPVCEWVRRSMKAGQGELKGSAWRVKRGNRNKQRSLPKVQGKRRGLGRRQPRPV